MHIIGHATITLHLKNLRVTYHFIVVKSLMTDVILGIDFQREYRISYDWDEEKRCYIRHKGQFLCYTEDMESGINRVSVAKTIRIPPKHNGAISVSIKGHDIKTPTACFIGSQYIDPEVKLIDGVHDISHNVTLQVLVINNSNQHVNFLKGMKIGHLEPPIDKLTQRPINSATTQWMLFKTVKPDSFTPPKYQLDATIQQQLDNLLRTFKDQFTKDEMTIGTMKRLLNKTAPKHELNTFFIRNGLLYRYASDHSKDFCTLVIPKAWRYTILVETHDKMGHQGNNRMYSLIK